jgi:transcriptional regulator with XRE-family HTH domain
MNMKEQAATRRLYRTLRARAGRNQRAIAQLARISLSRYWRIEQGYAVATADEATRLAKVLEVNVAALPHVTMPTTHITAEVAAS